MSAMGPYIAGTAFWIFIAAVCVTGMVTDYKRRRGNLELLRTAIEKGQPLDPALVEKLTAHERHDEQVEPVLVRLGGVITVAAGIGICLLSFFLSRIAPMALYPVLGGGVLVICIGAGLLVGARVLAEARARQPSPKSAP